MAQRQCRWHSSSATVESGFNRSNTHGTMISNQAFGRKRRKRKYESSFLFGLSLVFFYGIVSYSTRKGKAESVSKRFNSKNLYSANVRTEFISSLRAASTTVGDCITIFLTEERCPDATLSAFLENKLLTEVQIVHALNQGSQPCGTHAGLSTKLQRIGAGCQSSKCQLKALRTHLEDSKEKHDGLFFCVGCSEQEIHMTRAYYDSRVIDMTLFDFEQLIWVRSLTKLELVAWRHVRHGIVIVTTCRMETLRALLLDIQHSYFFGDPVDLHFAVDADASRACTEELVAYEWSHGKKYLHRRIVPSGGPQVAVPEAVPLVGSSQFQILLEDDVRVSDQFYSWLKFVTLQMLNCQMCKDENMFSVSLYTPRVVETGPLARSRLNFEKISVNVGDLFLYEVPCSWGATFMESSWTIALEYFQQRLAGVEVFPEIPDSRVNGWKGSWKKWLIELGYYRKWSTIYVRFADELSFSTNTLGKGEHIHHVDEEMRLNYTVPLIKGTDWYRSLRHKRLFERQIHRINLRGNNHNQDVHDR